MYKLVRGMRAPEMKPGASDPMVLPDKNMRGGEQPPIRYPRRERPRRTRILGRTRTLQSGDGFGRSLLDNGVISGRQYIAVADLSREEYERRYTELLALRRKALDLARAETVEIVRQLNAGGLIEPDGSQAYRNALSAERMALKAYTDALRAFNDFVLDGKIAEDEDESDSGEPSI